MNRSILDFARVIRSKNCSPFELTMDIIIKDQKDYEILKSKHLINKSLIATLYGIPEANISKVIYFDCARAIKITMQRAIPSSAPGDSDVYGAQQHGPLLGMTLEF